MQENNVVDIQTRALANGMTAAMALEQAIAPDKHPSARLETEELVQTCNAAITIRNDQLAAMNRKFDKIREKHMPEIVALNSDITAMEIEIAERIKARGGKGLYAGKLRVRIDQKAGKLVKNIDLLKKLATHVTAAEYAKVFKSETKPVTVEDFDARELDKLLEFYGEKSEVGALIAAGKYYQPTPAVLVIEPIEDEVAKAA